MIWARSAFGPITATVPSSERSNGSSPSLARRTIDSVDARRASARSSARSTEWPPPLGSRSAATRATMRSGAVSRRVTWASTNPSATSPARTAAASAGPKARAGPGISRSTPAWAEATVPATPNQSVTTNPSKPHSFRRMPAMSSGCSVHQRPLTRLWLVMTPSDPPLADRQLEGAEVDLAERPLVDLGADRVALELGVVAHEVLDRRRHALGLRPTHVPGGHSPGHQGILRVALEVG